MVTGDSSPRIPKLKFYAKCRIVCSAYIRTITYIDIINIYKKEAKTEYVCKQGGDLPGVSIRYTGNVLKSPNDQLKNICASRSVLKI